MLQPVDAVITVYPKTNIKNGHIWIQNGEIIPNAENVMAGENITMVCNVENYATWKNEYQGSIIWMKEGKDVSSDDDSRFLLENNSFTITQLMQNDSGMIYALGNIVATFIVFIQYFINLLSFGILIPC